MQLNASFDSYAKQVSLVHEESMRPVEQDVQILNPSQVLFVEDLPLGRDVSDSETFLFCGLT